MSGIRVHFGPAGASYSLMHYAVPIRQPPPLQSARVPLSLSDLSSVVLLLCASGSALLPVTSITALARCTQVPHQLTVRPPVVRDFLVRLLQSSPYFSREAVFDEVALASYDMPSGRLLATLLALQLGFNDLPPASTSVFPLGMLGTSLW